VQEHDAHATFFVIAAAAAAHPAALAAIVAGGHELGNHMTEDAPSWRLSPAAFAAQAQQVEELLEPHRRAHDGAPPARRWFRRAQRGSACSCRR
jgi:peptidoglycan/xylan/chitin deacetylase (PgdA/CDA1 family)